MQFVNPWVLLALAALAVPIIVHLFNFRRYKTVYFSNVAFLREVQEETTSRNRLKHLLVLASRMLAFTFLIFAFARPFIPNKTVALNAGKKFISIYIDNSFSMNAVSGGRSLFDKAKQAAKEIAGNFSADDQFQLLSNDFEGKQQRLVSKEEFLTMTEALEVSPAVRSLDEVTKRQKDALSRENGTNQVSYLLSDFQKNMGKFGVDSLVQYHLIPLAADAASNVYIDSVWFIEPVQLVNQPVQLVVKVSNSGVKASENNRMVIKLNGQTKSMSDFSVEAGSFVLDTLGFAVAKPGWNRAEITIQDFPITYDDNYFISFNAIEKMKVLTIGSGKTNSFIGALFQNQPEFDFVAVTTSGFDASLFAEKQLIILDGLQDISAGLSSAIQTYVSNGGAVLVFPAAKCDESSYNRFLNTMRANSITGFSESVVDMASINLQQNIFRDVFERVQENMNLPAVRKYYTFSKSTASSEETILTTKDGNSFLSRYGFEGGSLYICASPLTKEASDLPVHAIFAPMLYKMALMNTRLYPISYFIGDKARIQMESTKTGGEKVYSIKGNNTEFIPQQFTVGSKTLLGLNDLVKNAGFYTVELNGQNQNTDLALNFDRKESDLNFNDATELKEMYPQQNVNVVNGANAEVASVVKALDASTQLWKICLILALLFLAIEILLLRFWKA